MLKLYYRFLNLVDTSRPRIRKIFKKFHSSLVKLFKRRTPHLLMIVILSVIILLYSGVGLFLSAGPTLEILETNSFFSCLSIFAVGIYLTFKASLPKKQQNRTVNWAKIIIVGFVLAYAYVYWVIDKKYGQGAPLLAVGNACTVIGVTSIFVEMLLEECSSLRSQKKAMNVSSEEQKGQEH